MYSSNFDNLEEDLKAIDNGIEVSPVQYLNTGIFVIGRLVELGILRVRRDLEGEIHFMKADMDEFLSKVITRPTKGAR